MKIRAVDSTAPTARVSPQRADRRPSHPAAGGWNAVSRPARSDSGVISAWLGVVRLP